ncbi:protein kinase-like domain, concanavalin A-like lectin/glucanase domain protein [Tanacetum coccineum]
MVPLRSDTIQLVQNGCSFHGLRSEDPNQHLKDFLKLVDSLNLDGENKERTCLRLFQFSLRDQASNWLERLPAGSISTWEDLTTRFLSQFFLPGGPVVEYFDMFPIREELAYHRLSQVVLGRPFIEISNMTHDPPDGVVRFVRGSDEVAYKMPHKIEQYDSLSDLEKEHTKSVYLRNEEDKRRGVDYVMNKILGFYKECLELGPEYLTGVENEREVT